MSITTMFLLMVAGVGIVTVIALKMSAPKKGQENNGTGTKQDQPSNSGFSFLEILEPILSKLGISGLSGGTDAKTAQEFMPFDKIEDSMICISDKHGMKFYRMIIECNSINYALKTDEEQDIVDAQFRSAITGWNFPWGIYVQTRALDNRAFVQQTKNDVENAASRYPALAEYGRAYYDFISNTVSSQSNNMLIKKKYIIVACDEASTVPDLDDVDRQEWAFEKLVNRCQQVIGSLSKIGIHSHICQNAEISNIIIQAFNKKTGGAVDGVTSADFMTGTVSGDPNAKDFSPTDLQEMIREFVNTIDTKIMSSNIPNDEDKARAMEVERRAEALMDVFAEKRGGEE